MARLIPHADPQLIELDPERRVAEALCAQMPKKVVIFHSYPWLRPERDVHRSGSKDVMREGEADFVILHPRYGIMVVEVKGGDLFYSQQTLSWDRRGAQHAVKDPFDQASRNLRAIEEQLKDRSFGGYQQLPFTRARCVVFPHCDYHGTLPPGAHASMLLGASDMETLGDRIENLFKMQPFVPAQSLSEGILDGITKGLSSTFKLVPALWAEIEDQERKIFRFTEDQLGILKVLRAHHRAAVQGVAGSGKTILAITKARAFADEGKKVLFVCFNEMLADWLQSQLPNEYRDLITIRHYHKLCREWVMDAGLKWPSFSDEAELFRTEAPRLLEQAIDLQLDRSFDAVVVDEGQDFQPSWWDTIELLNKRPTEGDLYVFYDPDQQIFADAVAAMPDLGQPFVLPVNCRNTVRIASRCGAILGKEIPVNRDTPAGRTPKFIHAPTADQQVRATEAQVQEWSSKTSRIRPDQIAVVTRGKVENSSVASLKQLSGIPVVRSLADWKAGKGILVTSLYRFKGLEADALVLVDVQPPDPKAPASGFRPEHFYVGCSRAKHLLTVISQVDGWFEITSDI